MFCAGDAPGVDLVHVGALAVEDVEILISISMAWNTSAFPGVLSNKCATCAAMHRVSNHAAC